jgi:hypothetical protein
MLKKRSSVVRHIVRHVIPSLLLNAVAPFVVYSLLSAHMSTVHALMMTALVPFAENVFTLARHRRLDLFGFFVFLSLVLSSVIVLLGGSPRLILARESFLSAAFGLIMLLSLLCPQPLVYYLTGHFVAGHVPARKKEFRLKGASPWFRNFMRLLTVVWGMVTLADALLNVYLAFNVSITTFLIVSPIVRYGIVGCAFAWTVVHAQRGRYLSYMFAFAGEQVAKPGLLRPV